MMITMNMMTMAIMLTTMIQKKMIFAYFGPPPFAAADILNCQAIYLLLLLFDLLY